MGGMQNTQPTTALALDVDRSPVRRPVPRRAHRLRRLLTGALLALTGLGAVGVASPAPASAATNCSGDCITTAVAVPYAYDSYFVVNTSVPTKAEVFVDTDATWGGAFTMASHQVFTTSHTMQVTGLQPGRSYYFHTRVRDQNGTTRIESGRLFRMKSRKLTVEVDKIRFMDDSDALGNGEMWVHSRAVGIGGEKFTHVAANLEEDRNWGTGPWYAVDETYVVMNPPAALRIDVMAADDDGCVPPPVFDVKRDGCYESATTGTLYPDIPRSALSTRTGTLTAQAYGGVDFEVVVKYKLELVP
jgi:hypothetical protein